MVSHLIRWIFSGKKKSKFHYLCYCYSNKENKSVGLSYALTTVFWKKTKGRWWRDSRRVRSESAEREREREREREGGWGRDREGRWIWLYINTKASFIGVWIVLFSENQLQVFNPSIFLSLYISNHQIPFQDKVFLSTQTWPSYHKVFLGIWFSSRIGLLCQANMNGGILILLMI